MRAKAPAVKNKDLATVQHSANNAIMDDDSDDGYETAHEPDVQCNSSNLVAYATDSNGDSLFYDLDDQEDPDAVIVARRASTKPVTRNRSRSTQQNRPPILKSGRYQPKSQEDTSEKHPLGSMAKFLSNPTKILVDEQGELRGFSREANPQQKEAYRKYKQTQQKKSPKTGNLQTTTAEMNRIFKLIWRKCPKLWMTIKQPTRLFTSIVLMISISLPITGRPLF